MDPQFPPTALLGLGGKNITVGNWGTASQTLYLLSPNLALSPCSFKRLPVASHLWVGLVLLNYLAQNNITNCYWYVKHQALLL